MFAKYSIQLIIQDANSGNLKPMEYYGIVFKYQGIIRYDPKVMTGTVYMMPKSKFLSLLPAQAKTMCSCTPCLDKTTTVDNTTPGAGASASSPNGDMVATKKAGGLALVLYGIATVLI